MKKTLIQLVTLLFLGISAFPQEQVSFRFSNPQIIIGESSIMQFDIDVKADNSGNFYRDFQVYINYNSDAFGESAISNNVVSVIPLALMANHYSIVNTADNTSSRFSIVTDANAEMTQSGSTEFFNELPVEYTGFVRVEMNIKNIDFPAGISFDETLMNGGQFIQSLTSTEPIACANPNVYTNELSDFSLFGMELNLNQGWLGLSSYMIPFDSNIEKMMSPIASELVILRNFDGVYYPEINLNTLGEWNNNSGYVMKVSGDTQLKIFGTFVDGGTITLSSGWNIIPILSSCSMSTEDLFGSIQSEIVVVKEVAGINVYWPEQGINSLSILDSGKSYYVKMKSEQTITFSACE